MNQVYGTTYPEMNSVETQLVPEVRPAVYVGIPEAAQRVYERGSIAETIQRMFAEVDQYPVQYAQSESEYAWDVHPHNPEAYQDVMREIHDRVKNSDVVKTLLRKVEQQEEIVPSDVEAVFRRYELIFNEVLSRMKDEMTAKQMNVLKFQAHSELDYSFRDVITRHLVLGNENEMKFDPLDFFLLLNPKARKIDYMSNKEILATVRHSMSIPTMSSERLRNDVRAVESQSHRSDYKELVASHEVQTLQTSIN